MNMPAWSLFFELVVNFLYAAFLIRIRERAMIAIAALSGAALVWFASSSPSLDIGYGWATFSGGLARAAFTFTIGVIIARRQRATARGSALAMLPPIALVGLLVVPVPTTLRIVYDLLVAMTAAPLLVWLAAIYNPRPELESMSRAAGDLSYAVYAIHVPLLWIVASVIRHFDVPRAIVLPIFIALLLAGCRALDRHYDAPIRARLNGMLLAATLRAKSTATE
jgi:peptidoglycan/LPS O-acetylase OafA/YrhL